MEPNECRSILRTDRQGSSSDSSGSASPKRVTFVLPPPTPRSRCDRPGSPQLRRRVSFAPRCEDDYGYDGSYSAADQGLVHIPEVDSPRAFGALTLSPLATCRRWPSNEALYASDEEISKIDMSDLLFAPSTPDLPALQPPPATSSSFSLLDFLPAAPTFCQRHGQQPGVQAVAAAAAAAAKKGQQATGTAIDLHVGAAPTPPAELISLVSVFEQASEQPSKQPASLSTRLTGLLGRLLSAAAASSASIAELAAMGSGSLDGLKHSVHSGANRSMRSIAGEANVFWLDPAESEG